MREGREERKGRQGFISSRPSAFRRRIDRLGVYHFVTKSHGRVAFLQVLALIAMVFGVVHPAAAQLAPPYSPDYEDELFAAVAQAHGMPDLKQTTLPPAFREIRIRDHLSMMGYVPTPMLRLVSGEGRAAEGELLLFRRIPIRPGNPPPLPDERCVPLRDEHVCVRTWVRSFDWFTVARMLNELDAWEIAGRCDYVEGRNSGTITDVGALYIQRLIGRTFSSYRCNAPQYRTTTDSGRQANAIYQYFRQLVGPVPVR